MYIEGVFSPLNLLLSWSIFTVIKLLFINKKKGLDIWLVLALIGGLMLLQLSLEYGIAWYSGYLEEIFSYGKSVFLFYELVLAFTLSLGLIRKFRDKKVMRILQVVFVVMYLTFHLIECGDLGFKLGYSIIPGWDAITVYVGSFYGVLLWLSVFLFLELRLHRK